MSKTLYLDVNQITKVKDKDVYLKNIAKIFCDDKTIENKCNALKVRMMHGEKHIRYVGSVLEIIEKINELDSSIQINNIGEVDFIIDYQPKNSNNKFFQWVRTIGVCCVSFFGAAFAIMTFNNDSNVGKLFRELYFMVMGSPSDGFGVLEISYSVGLAVGIIGFFNHLVKKKVSLDPTPLEVEMRIYEEDVCSTVIRNQGREEAGMDGS